MIHSNSAHTSLKIKVSELKNNWARAQADLANYKSRIEKERSEQQKQNLLKLVEPLLDLADNFRAMADQVPGELKDNAWAQGVMHVARQLDQILEAYNVRAFSDSSIPFDPERHEAIETVSTKGKSANAIVEVVRSGYMIGDQVIRPAQVKVSK